MSIEKLQDRLKEIDKLNLNSELKSILQLVSIFELNPVSYEEMKNYLTKVKLKEDKPKSKSLRETAKEIGNDIKKEFSKVGDELKLNFGGFK